MNANDFIADPQHPLVMHPGDADHAVFGGLRVDRPLSAVRMAKDGRHGRISLELEIGEGPIVPDAEGRKLQPLTGPIIVVGRGLGDRVLRALFVIWIAELHDVEGRVRRLLDVEVIAPAVGIDGDIGMNAARKRLDRKGPPAWDTVDLEPFGVARDDRPDCLTSAPMGQFRLI